MTPVSIRKPFGLWRSTSLVMGNMVGSGIFILPSALAVYGSISLIGWAFTAIGAIFLALVFARLSRRFPETGGPYAFSNHAFGDFVGFQIAWSYWIANWVSNAAVAVAGVSFLSTFWPNLASNPTYGFLASLSSVWILTFINASSLRSTGILQVVTTVLKLVPLVLIAIVGVFYIDLNNFKPFIGEGKTAFAAINGAAALALFGFMGLESATIPAENVLKPEKTIPRATILGTVLVAILYMWVTAVVIGILSPQGTASSSAAFADVGRIIFGHWAAQFVAVSAAISCFGTLNGWIFLQGQVPLAAARDRLFPKPFAKVNKKGIPIFGLLISSVLVSLLLMINYEAGLIEQFRFIVNLTAFSILLPYLYSSAADLLFIINEQNVSKSVLIKRGSIALAAFGYSFWTIAGVGQEVVYLGSFLIFGGLPFYVWMKKSHLTA
jgi:APA family basic amino acid/polyamine antiporter